MFMFPGGRTDGESRKSGERILWFALTGVQFFFALIPDTPARYQVCEEIPGARTIAGLKEKIET